MPSFSSSMQGESGHQYGGMAMMKAELGRMCSALFLPKLLW